uniref:Equilibrative nucleoside transporter 1 n=1 Tax=Onchocerca volvulus TaxID=6282 RepID=A0A8R1TPT2_ONCVO
MLSTSEPIDRFHAVYLIILLNGFGILITWNMWITIAPAYYMEFKLIEVSRNGTKYTPSYASNFLNYLIVASNLPNFMLNLINLFFTFKGSLEKRIGLSLMVVILICLITFAFTIIDTSNTVMIFFIITMISVVIQNAACGVYQNSLYGLVAIFPPQYTNAILIGSNLCGIVVSIIDIITLVATNNIKAAAFFYFFASLMAILACFGSLFALERLIRIQCFNVWFTFVVILTLFPTVMAGVKYYSETGKYNFFIPEKLFTPVTTYLFCNFFLFSGSFLANFVQWPQPKWLVVPVVVQAVFIPLMLSCNFRPEQRTWGIWIHDTWIYIAIVITMSTCCGYFSSLAMMYAPKQVEASKSTIAGMITALFLIFGVVCGTLFTFAVLWFIDCLGPLQPSEF